MTVIPTVAQVQGLAAMAVHEPAADFESVVVAMSNAAGHARHGGVTVAEGAAMTMAGPCRAGDVLGIVMGDFVEIGDSMADVAWAVVQRLLTPGGELLTLVPEPARTTASRSGWPTGSGPRGRASTSRWWRAGRLATRSCWGWNDVRLAPSPWRTDTFRRLNNRLENVVGAKTAKPFETLKIWTVGT